MRIPTDVSERETEVLAAVGARLSNAQIANRLHISVRTVEGHVSALLRKFGVADRRELGALAETVTAAPAPGRVAALPVSRTSFVGRAAERVAIRAALDGGGLVTLVGPGGAGKTRLAVVAAGEVAPEFPFGVGFVDLVPVRDGFVAQAVAAALGVTERAGQPLDDAVLERLGRGRSLLVLDNCEHMIGAVAGFVERVRVSCPGTAVLATSRERLGVPDERIVPVAALPLRSDAEQLFRERAAVLDPVLDPDLDPDLDPAAVAELCARLDGLPLAIELAAARSASLGVAGLLAGLGDHLRLLSGGRGAVERHRSLRAVTEWSHDLLDDQEQGFFRRLGVFVGRFDLAAATAVAGDGDAPAAADLLGRLVDKSLVSRSGGSWRMLDSIRAFAVERLGESGAEEDVRQRHLNWAAGTAAELEGGLADRWRDRFDVVADDLRAALAGASPGDLGHGLARSLAHLTFARRFLMEALGHYRTAAQLAPDPDEAAVDLGLAAECAQVLNDSGEAYELHLAAAERAGDGPRRALELVRAVEMACRYPVTFQAEVPHARLRGLLDSVGDHDDPYVTAALACAEAWLAGPEKLSPDRALAEAAVAAAWAAGDAVLVCAALDALRTAATAAGDAKHAHRVTEQRLGLLPWMDRTDPRATAEIDDTLGLACSDAVAAGDVAAARTAARIIVEDELHGDHPYLTASKVIPTLVLAGELAEAVRLAEAMWTGWTRAGRPPAFWMQATVHFVALAHGLRDNPMELTRWRGHAAEVESRPGAFQARISPLAAFVDARVAVHLADRSQVDPGAARAVIDRADAALPKARYRPYAIAAAAELAVVAALPDAKDVLTAAQPAAQANDWAAACLTRARGRLLDDPAALRSALDQWERLGALGEAGATRRLLGGGS
ncbi:ATP-binding protein [Pseudonocardia sp. TRM90224]|uniref:ATP-binding protein n=1 Tax=Pseudonocardia sp. TRM90224 TaxID=2812678 RepID=UPI001E61D756|nr:LuxR C-terminal-related transcriptional regulator [Pseudonocardia sp. TRM90224]